MKVYFPPRLLDLDESIADPNKRLDDALWRYAQTDPGICILGDEDTLKDAIAIINLERGRPRLQPKA